MKTKPLDSPIRVVGYIRGSTEEQQNTLVAQRTQIEDYCRFKKFDLARVFVDEGQSAMSTDFFERPIAAEMIAWMRENGATAIVITKLDRGFRGAVDLLLTIEDLERHEIGLHLLDIGLDPTSPVGKMVATIMASVARYECERRSERQLDSFAAMRTKGQRTGAVSFGWDAIKSTRVSKTGRQADDLIINEGEMKWLRQILAWNEEGVSACEIARRLNTAGVQTKNAGVTMHRKGRTWVCDGRWAAASVQSVCQHARLPEEEPAALAA